MFRSGDLGRDERLTAAVAKKLADRRLLADGAKNRPTGNGVKPRPGNLWLLWVPVYVKRWIEGIGFQRATIHADAARAMKLARSLGRK